MQSLKKKTHDFVGMSSKDNKGFTIIEVMIVLVIAAVIILIVFLAVPALQRNSRNNQRKSDASRVLAAAQEWRTSNNNAMPTTAAHATAISGNAGTLAIYTGVDLDAKNTTTYDDLTNNNNVGTWASATRVNLVTNAKCETSSTKRAGNGVIAVYQVETGSSVQWLCVG